MAELVQTERFGRVMVVRMTRANKRNAINRQLADELDAALNELDDEPDIWAGVLTGSEGCFSAGSDLAANGDNKTTRGGEYGIIRRQRRKPLVAAVEGPALGGGLEIVLACDLVVAGESARFGFPEVSRGVLATCAGLFRGPRALPLNLAREMLLTGDPIGPQQGREIGFVNRVTPDGEAETAAVALAQRICENAPVAVQASMEAVNTWLAAGDNLGWTVTEAAMGRIAVAEDTQEGIAAFLAKRPPVWKGR